MDNLQILVTTKKLQKHAHKYDKHSLRVEEKTIVVQRSKSKD